MPYWLTMIIPGYGYPVFDRLGRKLAEWLLNRKELRARSLLQQPAKERYVDFVKQYPDLVKRVPQYHIASYLGITKYPYPD